MIKKRIHIVKGSGEETLFSRKKVFVSLRRAGAERTVAKDIADTIAHQVKHGMSTKEIYKKAFALLKKSEQPVTAARYSLKQSIMQLGPTGYPFEVFIGELLKAQGYNVKTGQVLKGKCVTHEIDVVAQKEHRKILIEAKFHNTRGYVTDVKVPLYIKSRFDDVKASHNGKTQLKQWIVTNTKFSKDAATYGSCVGLKMVGWRYPAEGGLEHMIESVGLHPVTCMTTINDHQKKLLIKEGIVMCKTIVENPDALMNSGLSKRGVARAISEASQLCFGEPHHV